MAEKIADYWKDKQQNAARAKFHYRQMELGCSSEILYSIHNTHMLDENLIPNYYTDATALTGDISEYVFVREKTTVEEILNQRIFAGKKRILALNFASYKHPGGAFLTGSMAQEESLCHSSTLYNVLSRKLEWYNENHKSLNHGLYSNRGLLSQDVMFFGEDGETPTACDVLTVAAPNARAASMQGISWDEIYETMASRIQFVCNCIMYGSNLDGEGYSSVILGAFGCGVFGNDVNMTADQLFLYIRNEGYRDMAEKVIFAVPKGHNLDAFNDTFIKHLKDSKNNRK